MEKVEENYKMRFLSLSLKKALKSQIHKFRCNTMSAQSVFNYIYQENYWGGESRSGPGSGLEQTKIVRKEISKILNDLEINSILDIPCGDFHWFKEMDLTSISYIGADIVKDLIDLNTTKYSKPNRTFVNLDIRNDKLPNVDLILCRDLFVHLSFNDIQKSIKKIQESCSKYLLITSYPSVEKNHDIKTGLWRALNMEIPPFSFLKPIRTIDEKPVFSKVPNKSVLLIDIEKLFP